MAPRFKYILVYIFCCSVFLSEAQPSVIDSLKKAIASAKKPDQKVVALNELAWILRLNNPDTSILLSNEALELSRKLDLQMEIGQSYHQLSEFYWRKSNYPLALDFSAKALAIWEILEKNNAYPLKQVRQSKSSTLGNAGIIYVQKGELEKGMEYHSKALEIDEDLGNKVAVSRHLSNMGSVYLNQGNYPKAQEYYLRSLKMDEASGRKQEIGVSYSNLGNIYFYQSDLDKALVYYLKALKADEEYGNKTGLAHDYGYIGNVYLYKHDSRAAEYYLKALKLSEELGNKHLVAAWLGNMGSFYFDKGDFERAIEYFNKGFKISESLGDFSSISNNLGNMGASYIKLKKYKEAEDCLLRGLVIADKTGELDTQKEQYKLLSEVYALTGRFEKAYENHVRSSLLKDSLYNEEKHNEITRNEMNYEFDKKEMYYKAEQEKQELLAAADNKRKNTIIWSVILGLLLVMVFSVFLYKRFRITQRQKQVIESQKHFVEEKNREVMDSITYAKRLQVAVLPDDAAISELLENYFLLYKPRDIVSGDFYFIEPIRTNDGRHLVAIAVADCTGHGVPGAFMSMLGYDILKNSLNEKSVNTASEALNYLNSRLSKTLRSTSNQQVRDGMDIAFCVLYNDIKKLYFSGANNPCWIIRKDKTFVELKADKQPIGFFENSKPFTLQSFDLQEGDMFYAFTDGYADQFGGPKGKKFKYRQLQELLMEIHELDMSQQKKKLEEAFNTWKGDLEQVDDVCIVGVRV